MKRRQKFCFGGVIFGIILKIFLSPEANAFIEENIFNSIRDVFMNALMTDISRIGGKFIFISPAKVLVLVIIGVFCVKILFGEGIPEIISAIPKSTESTGATFSLKDMIVGRMFISVGNIVGDVDSTLLLAKSEEKLDEKIYSS